LLNNRLGALLRMALRWKGHIWYRDYKRHIHKTKKLTTSNPIDIIVLVTDHYEPAKKDGAKACEKVNDWCENYANIASEFVDSDGIHPQHTWFYRYDFPDFNILNTLSRYVHNGFGEIEFHLHHGFDTSDTFNEKIENGVQWFNSSGAMISAEEFPQQRFAYIAGNWALDNGRNDPQFSGVNDEIRTLSKHGCYADFTFPAIGCDAQPEKVNSIYYATDDPEKPKSYNTGVDVTVGGTESGDLMIVEGPIFLNWQNSYLENGAFESFQPYIKERLKYWENAHVHVKGRPEWIFMKLHTHGMQSKSIFSDGNFKELCQDLDTTFGKDSNYRLHYVTSREAYNIIKAAEAGLTGNPNEYRNYLIKQPINKMIHVNKPYSLKSYSENYVNISINQPEKGVEIRFNNHNGLVIFGNYITNIAISLENGSVSDIDIDGQDCKYVENDLETRIRIKSN